MKKSQFGFSLIELMVVVSIIGILSAVGYANFSQGSAQSRDAQRQADIRIVSTALELYKNKYGRYPEGCNGPTTGFNAVVWSGHSSLHKCGPGDPYYIVGLAPEFIPRLPQDPKLNGADSGYVYAVNTSRSVFKFMALNTVEAESVAPGDTFFRCGADFTLGIAPQNYTWRDSAMCRRVRNSISGNKNAVDTTPDSQMPQCTESDQYSNDYAISGGYSSDNRGNTGTPEKGQEFDTEIVRCH